MNFSSLDLVFISILNYSLIACDPANVVAAPTPLKKIASFEKPPAWECKSTTKGAQVAKPNGKAHITEPISLHKTTEKSKDN